MAILGKRALSPEAEVQVFKKPKCSPFSLKKMVGHFDHFESMTVPVAIPAQVQDVEDVVMDVEPADSPMDERTHELSIPCCNLVNINDQQEHDNSLPESTLRVYPMFANANVNRGLVDHQTVRGSIPIRDPQNLMTSEGDHERSLVIPTVTNVPPLNEVDIGGSWIYDNCNGGMIFVPTPRHYEMR